MVDINHPNLTWNLSEDGKTLRLYWPIPVNTEVKLKLEYPGGTAPGGSIAFP